MTMGWKVWIQMDRSEAVSPQPFLTTAVMEKGSG